LALVRKGQTIRILDTAIVRSPKSCRTAALAPEQATPEGLAEMERKGLIRRATAAIDKA